MVPHPPPAFKPPTRTDDMTLDPLLHAPLAVQLHVAFAVLALPLGIVAFLRRSRDGLHRWAGRGFALAIGGLALGSFWIGDIGLIGPFSPIHLLSVWVLWGLGRAIWAIRQGDIATHEHEMRGILFQAMPIAGVFTLLPGRRLNAALFPEAPVAGFVLVLLAAGLILAATRLRRRREIPLGNPRTLR